MNLGYLECTLIGITILLVGVTVLLLFAIFKKKGSSKLKKVKKEKPKKREVNHKAEIRVRHKPKGRGLYVTLGIILGIFIIAGIVVFVVPLPFDRVELYTVTEQYETKEAYQETVNQDNCNDDYDCSCTKHGGFLWLTCVQCSCTKYRTVVREKLVLKERTATGYATLFQSLTNAKITKTDAIGIADKLFSFISSRGSRSYSIGGVWKEGDAWKVSVSSSGGEVIVAVNSNNGEIGYINYPSGLMYDFDNYLRQINSY